MKKNLSERLLVVVLFVIVLVMFSLAKEDTKSIEKMNQQDVSVSSPVELAPPDAVTEMVEPYSTSPTELAR